MYKRGFSINARQGFDGQELFQRRGLEQLVLT
jgi:hypothetical protein